MLVTTRLLSNQSNQSAGRRGRVLQITVDGGVDPRGGARDRPLSRSFQWAPHQSDLSLTSVSAGKTLVSDVQTDTPKTVAGAGSALRVWSRQERVQVMPSSRKWSEEHFTIRW